MPDVEKRHISPSQIATWTRCRHLWAEGRKQVRGPEGGASDTWAQRIGHFVHAVEEEFKGHDPFLRSEGLWLSIPTYVGEQWMANGVEEDLVKETRRRSKPILNQLWDTFGADKLHVPTMREQKLALDLTPDCELWVVFDDITLVEADKTLIIGEYKTSQSPIDPEERTLMNIQSYVYQWAAKQQWPDYKPVAVSYTLAHKGGAERVVRDLWPEDVAEWDTTLRRLPDEIKDGVIYRALSPFACRGCPLWYTDCSKRIKRGVGPVGPAGGYVSERTVS